MRYKRLIIISWQNYDIRIESFLAIKELVSIGVEIEYWDVTSITIPENKVEEYMVPNGIKERIFVKIGQFEEAVSNCDLNLTLFIPYMNYCFYTHKCYKILSKYKCCFAYIVNGCLPSPVRGNRKRAAFLSSPFIFLKKVHSFFKWKYNECHLKMLSSQISPSDYLLKTCGMALSLNHGKISEKTKIIDFNSGDYQYTLEAECQRSKEILNLKNYIVFVDQFLPFHPDRTVAKLKPINHEKYYEELDTFFRMVENKYGKKVVIAAHPTSTIVYSEKDYFNGREIYKGKTMELIQNSDGVILHFSTALSYAVIYKKPILFYFTSEMRENNEKGYRIAEVMADILRCPLYDLNLKIVLPDKLRIDSYQYDYYKYSYLTNKESENVTNGKILSSLLLLK